MRVLTVAPDFFSSLVMVIRRSSFMSIPVSWRVSNINNIDGLTLEQPRKHEQED